MPENYLTVDQVRAVELDASKNRAIVGGPGSGKTLVLLYRAALLSKQLGSPPDRYRMFVFTRSSKLHCISGPFSEYRTSVSAPSIAGPKYYLGNVGERADPEIWSSPISPHTRSLIAQQETGWSCGCPESRAQDLGYHCSADSDWFPVM